MPRSLSSPERVVVFDLDDTLYKEINFLYSAYREIAALAGTLREEAFLLMKTTYERGGNAFEAVIKTYLPDYKPGDLIEMYRRHLPDIALLPDALACLTSLREQGSVIGLITDGRETTQMAKIKALGLLAFVDSANIVISESFGSEKPCEANYLYFMKRYPGARFTYVGDNVKKDFLAPNRLGWQTVCLKNDGRNIHTQDMDRPSEYLPKMVVERLTDWEV